MREHPPPAEIAGHLLNVALYSWALGWFGFTPWGFWKTYLAVFLAFACVSTASKSWRAGQGWFR